MKTMQTQFCYILFQLFFVSLSTTLSGCTFFSVRHSLDDALAALQPTGWRLGASAAFTHYLSNPHFPPPLRQTAR
jgi:hypothetical protein